MFDTQFFYQSSDYYLSNDGLKLHYRDIGNEPEKETVVCIPGLTRNSRDFEYLASEISGTYRVICPDLRGRAYSEYDRNWQNYHPLTYSDDIWRLLDHLKIDKAHIIGTSLGGLIAMVMASQNAGRIYSIIMNDIGPEIDKTGLIRIKEYAGHLDPVNNWEEACQQTKAIYGPWLKGLDDSMWFVLTKRAYRVIDNQLSLDMDNNIGKAIREVGEQKGDPWQFFDALKDINTLVLRGEISDILSDDILQKMHMRNPSLKSAIIPDRGHVPLLDEIASLKAIKNFLKIN